jgi:hypothetical protein
MMGGMFLTLRLFLCMNLYVYLFWTIYVDNKVIKLSDSCKDYCHRVELNFNDGDGDDDDDDDDDDNKREHHTRKPWS